MPAQSYYFCEQCPFCERFLFFFATIKLSQLSLLCLCHFEVSNNHHVAHSESAIIFTMPTRSQAMIFTSNNIHKAHSESAMIFTNARSESSLFLRTMPFLANDFLLVFANYQADWNDAKCPPSDRAEIWHKCSSI
ncbi:hypothetical protein L596_000004 [Steinernema carpocapsae]|uniref:Uncharacterized protein n=1 Tax=Steinernema carpocapsae TaxID=34508 RepID=A0A4U8UHU8_STECR|nr:hypothetical protein L596_000004 [Steinernema carpocapsae]